MAAEQRTGTRPNRAAAQVERELRHIKALELRGRGLTFRQIAAALGYESVSSAHDAVNKALTELRTEQADALRALESARLDELLQAHFPVAIGKSKGALAAVSVVLKIMERRAKLFGLDAPVKVAPTDPEGTREWGVLSEPERAAAIAELINRGLARADGANAAGTGPQPAASGETAPPAFPN